MNMIIQYVSRFFKYTLYAFAVVWMIFFVETSTPRWIQLIFIILWLIICILIWKLIQVVFKSKVQTHRSNTTTLDEYSIIQKLREISPKDFEDCVSMVYMYYGRTITTKADRKKIWNTRHALPDSWIDWIYKKNHTTNYIQIKKLITHQVSVSIVRDFYGAITDSLQDFSYWTIVTTSVFSKDAIDFAESKWIVLINYVELLWVIKWLPKEKLALFTQTLKNYKKWSIKYSKYAKTCHECYAPLVKRKWNFYGCMNYYFTWCRWC
jgi:hypothetical protein